MTNETAMLMALRSGLKINPKFQPQNNKQAYLAYLCGLDIDLPEPRTTEEVLLYKLCADGGKYLHTMTIRTYLGKITMTLKNNSAESLTGVYKESTDIFNGATLMIPAADIGQDEDFYATVIGYEGGDVGLLAIDKDFPFPVISSMPNVIEVMLGEVIDTVTTKDGGKIEQEKKVEITKNGVTEIFPDEGYALSKVTAVVSVPTSTASKLPQVIDRTVTEITAEDLAGITKIGYSAFNNCASLTSIIIPNGVTHIDSYAFSTCSSLASIAIPDGVTRIGSYAFLGCSRLTSIAIPDSVTRIDADAFTACYNLKSLYYGGNIASWCNKDFGSFDVNPLYHAHNLYIKDDSGEYKLVENLTIPDTITTINDYVFSGCSLISLVIPDNVTTVGKQAFGLCKSLESVIIGSGITSISGYLFSGCSNLTNITIPRGITNIGQRGLGIGSTTNKATITFLPTTPPTIHKEALLSNQLEKIIVPKGCGEAYKTATNWANFADYIEEATE